MIWIDWDEATAQLQWESHVTPIRPHGERTKASPKSEVGWTGNSIYVREWPSRLGIKVAGYLSVGNHIVDRFSVPPDNWPYGVMRWNKKVFSWKKDPIQSRGTATSTSTVLEAMISMMRGHWISRSIKTRCVRWETRPWTSRRECRFFSFSFCPGNEEKHDSNCSDSFLIARRSVGRAGAGKITRSADRENRALDLQLNLREHCSFVFTFSQDTQNETTTKNWPTNRQLRWSTSEMIHYELFITNRYSMNDILEYARTNKRKLKKLKKLWFSWTN